jgi:hypothetical protein
MKGRKPKIDGELRGHHKKKPPLPLLPPGAPVCPEYLTGPARAEWNRLCQEQADLNRLSPVFRASMEGAAAVAGVIVGLQRKLKTCKDAKESKSLRRELNQYLALRLKHLAELGLTPVSRARAKDDSSSKQTDPLGDFLRGGTNGLN